MALITFYLLFVLFLIVLYRFLNFYRIIWRINKYTANLPSLPTIPFLGNCGIFVGVKNGEDIHNAMAKLLDDAKYILRRGPTKLWMGPVPTICVALPDDLQIVLTHALDKTPELYNILVPLLGTPLLYEPVPSWKKHRKLFHPVFSKLKCYNMVDKFSGICTEFVEGLESLQKLGMSHEGLESLLDFTIAKSVSVNLLGVNIYRQQLIRRSTVIARRLIDILFQRMCKFWLHSELIYRLTPNYREQVNLIEELKTYIGFSIETRREIRAKVEAMKLKNIEVEDEPVFVDILLDMRERGEYTEDELQNEVFFFLAASSDTTIFGIYMTLLMLAMHPDIQDKLYQEIEHLFGDSSKPIKGNDLKQTQYLDMVIKETLRLYPPLTTIARKAQEDIKLESMTIPKGCIIFPTIQSVHKNPDIWQDPEKFDPERFHPDIKRHPYSYLPFSAGPRNCIGYEFAMVFMKLIIISVLRKFMMTTECKHTDIKLSLVLTTKVSDAKPINFIKRELINNNEHT